MRMRNGIVEQQPSRLKISYWINLSLERDLRIFRYIGRYINKKKAISS